MKYKVTVSTLWVDGVKHKRGDIVETDVDYGTSVEPFIEADIKADTEKPKRKRRTKAEMLLDVPKLGDGDLA